MPAGAGQQHRLLQVFDLLIEQIQLGLQGDRVCLGAAGGGVQAVDALIGALQLL
jgi:hypothetical protein